MKQHTSLFSLSHFMREVYARAYGSYQTLASIGHECHLETTYMTDVITNYTIDVIRNSMAICIHTYLIVLARLTA